MQWADPEIWGRMTPEERSAKYLIGKGYLEACDDFEYEGETIEASRLGYRITSDFVQAFEGRVFSNPRSVFPEHILRPEQQDMEVYVDGIKNIIETQGWVAKNCFEDGSIEVACPPLKALLHIKVYGECEGLKVHDEAFRNLFTY